jgi:hypothetical protein
VTQRYETVSGHVVLFDDGVALPGRLSIGSHGYAQLCGVLTNDVVLLHRWLLGLVKGDRLIGDHVNGDRLDCRLANLRVVTAAENSANKAAFAGSGFRGVYPCRGRWQAAGKRDGRKVHLGTYDEPEIAAAVAHAWRVDNLPGYVDRPAARRVAV